MIFLSNLIVNYPDEHQGISEADLESILDSLLDSHKERFNINHLHALAELMNRHSWSDSLKRKIFSANDLSGGSLNEIIANSGQNNYAWIEAEPLLLSELELSFHQKAKDNDLRHYFYQVLEGEKSSTNFDDLIKSYGQSEEKFNFEEIKNLFLDNKIDRKYIPYFINKTSINDVIAGLDGGTISEPDQFWLLESILKYGPTTSAIRVFRRLKAMGVLDNQADKLALINYFANNVLLKCDSKENNTNHDKPNTIYAKPEEVRTTSNEIFDSRLEEILGKDDANLLGKKILNGALEFSSANQAAILVLQNNPEKIKTVFPEEEEQKKYLTDIFNKVADNPNTGSEQLLIRVYFQNPELLSVLDEGTRFNLENKIIKNSLAGHAHALLDVLDYMDARQQETFITLFEKTVIIAGSEYSYICHRLANKENFSKHPEVFKRAYLYMLNKNDLKYDSANTLFQKDIVLNDDDLRQTFFTNLARWREIDGTNILETMATLKSLNEGESKKIYSLSAEEIKQISTTTMQNRGLSPDFWKGYLDSDKNNPDFYLDAEIFRLGINNIGNDCLTAPGDTIVRFLKSVSESEFEFKAEDEQMIIRKALIKYSDSERIQEFYKYDAEFMENYLADYFQDYYSKILDADLNYSPEFNKKLLDYIMTNKFSSSTSTAEKLLNRLKKYDDQVMLKSTKKYLSKMSTENKIQGRILLLQYDLLDVEESKIFYKEVTTSSTDNARTQILNSIDIIGSMLSNRDNVKQLENFLDKPREEDVENLRGISEFISKYAKENKGRSIAVMLFAREYLPDRPLEEVIKKVASSLRKYEEIIAKNSYKNTPAGLRASIGMEYEITSSTAKGYEELTSQPSLKKDIARLSQAARIGSGRDAVHEIATKPTDNPYLMLLEMKLLHDIEYIDLNFDRSENYQKGARGFHLTIGGEKGLNVDKETNLLQNALIAASWGGVQSGETGHKVNAGRGVSLRGREGSSNNNVPFFGKATNSVELRSLSIDKQETMQRAVTTAFNGAIAIQAFQKCFPKQLTASELQELFNDKGGEIKSPEQSPADKELTTQIANLWINLVSEIKQATKKHNESFLESETIGYLDKNDIFVDASDFGGQYNRVRFESIVKNIDPTLSLEEYVKTTEIGEEDFLKSFNLELSDKLTKINNLYLKPGVISSQNGENKASVSKGDQANSLSMLKVTKIDNETLENYDDYFLTNTVFDAAGEKRKGYYCLQGGSQQMLTHAIQKSLLNFNEKMEKLLN